MAFSKFVTWEGVGVDKESNNKCHRKEGVQSKKWFSSQILLYTPFCNSFFIPSWFLMKPWWYYSEKQKEHIQEGAYQCIWIKLEITIWYLHKNIIIPLICQCGLFIHTFVSKNSIATKDVIFYLLRYNVKCDKVKKRWIMLLCKLHAFWMVQCLTCCNIMVYFEKVTSYEKFSKNLTLEVQIVW